MLLPRSNALIVFSSVGFLSKPPAGHYARFLSINPCSCCAGTLHVRSLVAFWLAFWSVLMRMLFGFTCLFGCVRLLNHWAWLCSASVGAAVCVGLGVVGCWLFLPETGLLSLRGALQLDHGSGSRFLSAIYLLAVPAGRSLRGCCDATTRPATCTRACAPYGCLIALLRGVGGVRFPPGALVGSACVSKQGVCAATAVAHLETGCRPGVATTPGCTGASLPLSAVQPRH